MPGTQSTATFTLSSSFSYSGNINTACDASALSGATCSVSPANPIAISSGGSATITVSMNAPNNAVPGNYTIKLSTQDTTGAPSHVVSFSFNLGEDFELTSSTSSQTITAGQVSGPYNLAVRPIGSSFSGAVTLACTAGLPVGAQCLFSPSAPVTPGSSAVDVVMTISTQATGSSLARAGVFTAIWLLPAMLLPGMLIVPSLNKRRKGRETRVAGLLLISLFLALLLSCAGVSSGGGGTTPPINPATYHLTVTGSSPGTPASSSHSVVVSLVIN